MTFGRRKTKARTIVNTFARRRVVPRTDLSTNADEAVACVLLRPCTRACLRAVPSLLAFLFLCIIALRVTRLWWSYRSSG